MCPEQDKLFRCKDCGHGHTLLCAGCMVGKHSELELHRVEVSRDIFYVLVLTLTISQKWNGNFFEKATLRSLGLRIQLGHDGGCCSLPIPAASNFLVFDISGVHQVHVDFCGCRPIYELNKRVQLLQKQWFPATTTRPQTVFTFDCLDMFHELTLQGKTSLYDFYHVLLRKTDNASVRSSIVSISLVALVLSLGINRDLAVPVPRDAPCFSPMAKSNVLQACWPRAWSIGS